MRYALNSDAVIVVNSPCVHSGVAPFRHLETAHTHVRSRETSGQIHFLNFNFGRVHKTLRIALAVQADLAITFGRLRKFRICQSEYSPWLPPAFHRFPYPAFCTGLSTDGGRSRIRRPSSPCQFQPGSPSVPPTGFAQPAWLRRAPYRLVALEPPPPCRSWGPALRRRL
jgi:hypothetical protein